MTNRVLICYTSLLPETDSDHTNLFYLSAALENAGFVVGVFHGEWFRAMDEIVKWQPDAIGFSCDAENQHLVEELIPAVQKMFAPRGGIPVVVGGPQAIGLGEPFMRATGCDYILRGEGDETLPALMKRLLNGEGSLETIPGLVWCSDGLIHENGGIGLVKDLNQLPRPAYHTSLHPNRRYRRTVFSGRGCPFECAFCVSGTTARPCRFRDIEDVLSEIRENIAHRPELRYFVIQDDTFCISPERVRAFCKGMQEIRRENPVVWYCETHVQTLLKEPDLLEEMVASGLVRLQIGMESGDENVLKLYRKHVTPDEILTFVAQAVKAKLPQITGNFIVGGPREKEGVTEEFIRKLLRTGPGVVDITTGFLRNYPGSAIADDPAAFGLRAVCDGGMTAGDDYPSVIPADGTVEETIALRQRLNTVIRAEIAALIDEHALPLETVIRQFRLDDEAGITSRWMRELMQNEMVHEYYKTIYLGEGVPYSASLNPANTYPQRTFDFYRTVIVLGGVPRIGRVVLTPLEYRVLFCSAGKMTIAEIASFLWPDFKRGYTDPEALQSAIETILVKADHRYWVTAFSYEGL